MADRFLLESGSPDGYLLEDGSGVLLLNAPVITWNTTAGVNCNSNLSFTADKLSFTQTTFASNTDAVRASAVPGATAFIAEFKISGSPSAFYIGIDDGTPDFSVTSFNPATSAASTALRWDGTNWWTYKNNAWTGYTSATGLSPASGVITMIGDTSAGSLSFYLNGTLLNTVTGISYTSWYAFATNADFAGNYDITANFAGPFYYPQATYSAYDPEAVASGTTVFPSTGHLTFTGYVPALNLALAPSVGHLTLGGKVPTVAAGIVLNPATGHLTFAGHLPAITYILAVSPPVGHLTFGGKVPAVSKGFNLFPSVGHLTFGGKVPSIATGVVISPASGHLAFGGRIPALTYNIAVQPSTGHLSLSGKVPSVSFGVNVFPATGHLAYGGKVATFTLAIAPATGHLTFTGYQPAVSGAAVIPTSFPLKVQYRHRQRNC